MTDRTWLGGGNNNARNPHDWSPTGAPQPGDSLSMLNGTMNVRDDDLAGNPVHVGDQAGLSETFNLSHHAMLAVVQNQFTSSATVVNVQGRDTLQFNSTFPSGSGVVVNLADHAQLSASFAMVFGGLTVNGGRGTELINGQSGDVLRGVQAVITPDVIGDGSWTVGNAQGVSGSIEFGHAVSRGQSVSISGDPGRGLAGTVQIDRPHEFRGAVTMQPKSEVDLVGLAKADSYTFQNDMLAIFDGNHVIDRLRLTNNGAFIGQPHDLVVSRSGSGDVWLTQAGFTSPPPGSTTLPLHG